MRHGRAVIRFDDDDRENENENQGDRVVAADRVPHILTAIASTAKAADLVSPGHVSPLRAAPGGVLARRGHTEAAVELARRAGQQPAAVLCEPMTEDGGMMRGIALVAFSRQRGGEAVPA